MPAPVYFDHNATTPLQAAVLDAMLPWLTAQFGNASSRHEYGRAARQAIDEARSQVAQACGAHFSEVLLTSSGSEANNLLIKGAAACLTSGVLAVSAIEHPSVLEPARQLSKRGWQLQMLTVQPDGQIDATNYQTVLAQKPKLISIMSANNETGVVQDVLALASQAQGSGAYFHTDAVQSLGKVEVNFRKMNAVGVQAMTIAAHKVGGPKGAAALLLDKRIELESQVAGGGHERGLRSGTENVAAIVGFGAACALLTQESLKASAHLMALRTRLEHGVSALGATLFSTAPERLPNTVYLALPDLEGETLVGLLDRSGFAVASGSACSSTHPGPSHVLQAMGVPLSLARGALRISLGASNTVAQVDAFLVELGRIAAQLKRLNVMAT